MATTSNSNPVASSKPQTVLCLLASDIVALLSSVALTLWIRGSFDHGLHLENYLRLWPFLFAFLMAYRVTGLYSSVALKSAGEFRRNFITTALVFASLAAVTTSLRGAQQHFTRPLLLSLATCVVVQPLLRLCTRKMLAAVSRGELNKIAVFPEFESRPIDRYSQTFTHVPVVPENGLSSQRALRRNMAGTLYLEIART